MQQLALIIRLLCKSKALYEISHLKVEDFLRILHLLEVNSYNGHLRISNKNPNTNTWMIFREGMIVEYFTVEKGCLEGDVLEFVKEFLEDEALTKPLRELIDVFNGKLSKIVLYEPNEELNEKVDYFLSKLSLGTNSLSVSELIEDLPEIEIDIKNSRAELLKKYRLKIPDEKLIDELIESAGFTARV